MEFSSLSEGKICGLFMSRPVYMYRRQLYSMYCKYVLVKYLHTNVMHSTVQYCRDANVNDTEQMTFWFPKGMKKNKKTYVVLILGIDENNCHYMVYFLFEGLISVALLSTCYKMETPRSATGET